MFGRTSAVDYLLGFRMKTQRTVYWWIFVIGGGIWGIGSMGIIAGMILYPKSNLLGGFGLVFGPIALLGASIVQVTFVVWLIHRLYMWVRTKLGKAHGG